MFIALNVIHTFIRMMPFAYPCLQEGPPMGPIFRGCQVACIGFTFTKDSPLNELGWKHYNNSSSDSNQRKPSIGLTNSPRHNGTAATTESSTVPVVGIAANGNQLIDELRVKCDQYEVRIIESDPLIVSNVCDFGAIWALKKQGNWMVKFDGLQSTKTIETRINRSEGIPLIFKSFRIGNLIGSIVRNIYGYSQARILAI